jgi:uncharacterized protein related to proFAR isomerase
VDEEEAKTVVVAVDLKVKQLQDQLYQDEFEQVFKGGGATAPEVIQIPKTTVQVRKGAPPLIKQQSRQELHLLES